MIHRPEQHRSNIDNEALEVPRERLAVVRRAVEGATIAFRVMGISRDQAEVPAGNQQPPRHEPEVMSIEDTNDPNQPMPDTDSVAQILAYAQAKAKTTEEQSRDVQKAA